MMTTNNYSKIIRGNMGAIYIYLCTQLIIVSVFPYISNRLMLNIRIGENNKIPNLIYEGNIKINKNNKLN